MNHAVEFHQVCKRYRHSWALRFASFRIPRGSITALLGPSGSGKSTAIRLALNLASPSAGRITLLDTPSRRLKPRDFQRIGYVADGMDLPLWMTLPQFLDWNRPLYPSWDTGLERTLLERFQLPDRLPLRHFSRGQRMKASLLSTLSYRPEILFLDEPFSGLDPVVRDEFLIGLLELTGEEPFTVVLASHDIAEVDRIADHVILLDRGTVVLDENAETLRERHRGFEFTLPPDFGSLPDLPHHWIRIETSGRRLRGIETRFDPSSFAAAFQQLFPRLPLPDTRPLHLREIFTSLVLQGKAELGL